MMWSTTVGLPESSSWLHDGLSSWYITVECLMIVLVRMMGFVYDSVGRYLPKHFQRIKPRLNLPESHFIINLYSCDTFNVDCALMCLAVIFRPSCEMLVNYKIDVAQLPNRISENEERSRRRHHFGDADKIFLGVALRLANT